MPPVLTIRASARYFLLSSSLVVLSGCVASPDYTAPTTQLPSNYSISVPVHSGSGFSATWWENFEDPALTRLIQQALSQNLDLAQARERVKEADAAARGTAPSANINANINAVQNSSGTEGSEASATFLLDFFGGRRKQAQAARARADAAVYGAQNARLIMLSAITNTYVELRYYQASLTQRNQDIRSRRKTLRDITTLLENGGATRLDQIRAQALLAEARAEVPPLTTQVARQQNRISTLLGTPAHSARPLLAAPGPQPRPKAVAAIGIPADLIRVRPDIRQAERLYAAALSDAGAARAARYPSLSLSGEISRPISGNLLESDVLAAGLNIPIFSQGALNATVDIRQSQAKQAFLEWRIRVLNAVEEVETALVAMNGSHATVSAAYRVKTLNEEALELSRQLLGGGNTTILDLLDRERALTNARATLAQSRRQYARDYVALNVALGLGSLAVQPAAAPANPGN